MTGMMNAAKALDMDEPAADHLATIDWARGEWADRPGKYSRQHLWVLAGAKLKASDSGALLPAAFRDKVAINPHKRIPVLRVTLSYTPLSPAGRLRRVSLHGRPDLFRDHRRFDVAKSGHARRKWVPRTNWHSSFLNQISASATVRACCHALSQQAALLPRPALSTKWISDSRPVIEVPQLIGNMREVCRQGARTTNV